jgi:acetyl esterase/lipase
VTTTTARPALDPELQGLLSTMPDAPPLNEETLDMIRPYATLPAEAALVGRTVDRQEIPIASFDGTQIALTFLTPAGADLNAGDAPCVYWVHGGGMVMGDRCSQIDTPLDWLASFGAVVVSVDYRLAPDFSGMTLVEDCYAGLVWTEEHAGDLGIDPAKLVIAGTSAGGGLAAAATLLARDRKGLAVAAQVCPMLDTETTPTRATSSTARPSAHATRTPSGGARSSRTLATHPSRATCRRQSPMTYPGWTAWNSGGLLIREK